MIWQIIGSIFAVDRGFHSSIYSFIEFRIVKLGLKKLETPFCRVVQSIFWYLEPRRHDSRVWRKTDRWTDMLMANAALHCVAWPKIVAIV